MKILTERVSDRSEEYYKYLENHIDGVKKSYESIKDDLLTIVDFNEHELDELEHKINNHDASKYDDVEFYPYLHHFYPSKAGADNEALYDEAWNHHQKCNDHHWQYWILQKDSGEQKILDMPLNCIIEMLCDWSSFKYNNPKSTAKNWYDNNKDKMLLSDNTKNKIEELLEMLPQL